MNINSRISIAISRFFRKYGFTIILIFFIWLVLFIINQSLKSQPEKQASTNSYNPDSPIIDDNGDVPEKYRDSVKKLISDYFTLCCDKKYSQAFDLLTDECKECLYNNNVELFKEYVRSKFDENKIYFLQNYSNVDDTYIYDLHVIDDLEATGGTNGYSEHKEKIAVVRKGSSFRLGNQGYIGRKNLDLRATDDNIDIKINYKDITYQRESYNVTFTNKTDKYVLISDGTYTDAVVLNLGTQKRNATNTSNATFVLEPNTTKTYNFLFDKFADDHKESLELSFNDIAIFSNYKQNMPVENAEKLYSLNVMLK